MDPYRLPRSVVPERDDLRLEPDLAALGFRGEEIVAGVAEDLRRRGHDLQVVEAWSDLMGHAQLNRLDGDGLCDGSDPRADGAALGW